MNRPRDTTPEAWEVQLDIWRRMGPEGRLNVMLDMCDAAAQTSKDGIRSRHPGYSDEEVHRAFLVLLWGEDFHRKAFPGQPVPLP